MLCRESIYIAFLLAGLNDVEVSVYDISSAYMNTLVGERIGLLLQRWLVQ